MTTIDDKLYSVFSSVSYTNDSSADGNLIKAALAKYNTDWQVLPIDGKYVTSNPNGMEAVAYGLNPDGNGSYGQIVIAYRGSDSVEDWVVDDLSEILPGNLPSQLNAADDFYQKVLDEYCTTTFEDGTKTVDSSKISLTGHSLGGALAQLIGGEYGNYTETFNAPGMAGQAASKYFGYSNIVNYVNMNDFIGSFGTHVGSTYYYLPNGITADGFVPHNDYVNADFSKYISLSSDWTEDYSLALWGYDVNNTHTVQKAALSGLITAANLKAAVAIVEENLGQPGLLAETMHYHTLSGDYIIGDSTGKEKGALIGSSNNDTIWGNAGDDVIIGGGGADSILGGSGSNILVGDTGNDTYCVTTTDGTDTILDTDGLGSVNLGGSVLAGGEATDNSNTIFTDEAGNTYSLANTTLTVQNGSYSVVIDDFSNGNLGIHLKDKDGNEVPIEDNTPPIVGPIQNSINGKRDSHGNPLDEYLSGTSANDQINGNGGSDNIMGGEGDDRISASDNSTAYGGDGNDNISLGNYGFADGGAGNDTIGTGSNSIVYGGSGNDNVSTGNYGNVYGGSGNDTIHTGTYGTVYTGNGNNNVSTGAYSTVNSGDGKIYYLDNFKYRKCA